MTNHFVIEDGEVSGHRLSDLAGISTLVLHGTDDPLFPPAHGRALAEGIDGSHLEEMIGVGHQLPPRSTWGWLTSRIAAHITSSNN